MQYGSESDRRMYENGSLSAQKSMEEANEFNKIAASKGQSHAKERLREIAPKAFRSTVQASSSLTELHDNATERTSVRVLHDDLGAGLNRINVFIAKSIV